MWRNPSTRFWMIKAAFFAVFFSALLLAALLSLFVGAMAGEASQPRCPVWLAIPVWMLLTPLRPGPRFPTSNGLANLFIAYGVNALLWSSLLSSLASFAISGMIRLFRRRPPAAA
jgi:hypothetical protein